MKALDHPAPEMPSEASPLSFTAATIANLKAEIAARSAYVADMPECAGKGVHLGVIESLEKQIAKLSDNPA